MAIDPTLLQLIELASASPLAALGAAAGLLWAPLRKLLADYTVKVEADLVRARASEELAKSVAKQGDVLAKQAEALTDIRNRVGCFYSTPPAATWPRSKRER
jgi:hypothetical protein